MSLSEKVNEASEKLNKALAAPPRRASLYDIASEILQVHILREEAEWEGDSARVEELDSQLKQYLRQELPAKVDSIRNYIRWQQNEAVVRTKEAQEQAILAGRAQDNIERIKAMCLWVMQQLDTKKLEGSLQWIRRQGNGGVRPLEIRQPELVPEEFMEVHVTLPLAAARLLLAQGDGAMRDTAEPATERIRAALERGEAVPGCVLGERGEHVRCS